MVHGRPDFFFSKIFLSFLVLLLVNGAQTLAYMMSVIFLELFSSAATHWAKDLTHECLKHFHFCSSALTEFQQYKVTYYCL